MRRVRTELYTHFKNLSKDDLKLIKDFANVVGFTEVEEYYIFGDIKETEDQYYDLFYTIDKYKKAHETEKKIYNERIENKQELLKFFDNDDFRNLIEFFTNENDSKFMQEKLNHVKEEFQDYHEGKQRNKDIRQALNCGISIDDASKYKSIYTLKEVRVLRRLFPKKETYRYPSGAYKELHRMIFKEASISTYNNANKLEKLINEIFEVTLKDEHIKLK